MKTYAPRSFSRFQCISSRCTHTCCAGWEIDVSDEAYQKYKALPESMRTWILSNLEAEPELHIRLCENERCPFLKEDGLCKIIQTLGEDYLTDICRDHPRFRNFFPDRTEIGLGLTCEEAARITLLDREPFCVIETEDDGECDKADEDTLEILEFREKLFEIARNREIGISKRLALVSEAAGLAIDELFGNELLSVLFSLERLDDKWTQALQTLSAPLSSESAVPEALAVPMEQLLCMLLYRHIPGTLYDGRLTERALVCVLLARLVLLLTLSRTENIPALDAFLDFARMMSSEIEYSDENLEKLLLYTEDLAFGR